MTYTQEHLKAVKSTLDMYGYTSIILGSYQRTCQLIVDLYVYKHIDKDEYLKIYDYIYDYYSIYYNTDITLYLLEYKKGLVDRIP